MSYDIALHLSPHIGSLYPLELIKTRMQVVGGENKVYRSFSKALVSVYRTEGMRGFFQGLSPALFAASGSWGGYFYFYEKSKDRKLQSKPSLETQDFVRVFPLLNLLSHLISSNYICVLAFVWF